MKYFIFFFLIPYLSYSQNNVVLKITDTIVYKDTPFNVSIKNNSEETFLFFIDQLSKGNYAVSFFHTSIRAPYPGIFLEDKNGIALSERVLITSSHPDPIPSREEVLNEEKTFKEQFKVSEKGVVVLKPNESFDFTMSLNLTRGIIPYYKVDDEKEYMLYLKFDSDLINFKKIIPSETLTFAEEFNIQIFNDSLISNKVPLSLDID